MARPHNQSHDAIAPGHATRREFVIGAASSVLLGAFSAGVAGCRRRSRPDDPSAQAAGVAPAGEPAPRESRPPLPGREPIVRVRVLRLRSPDFARQFRDAPAAGAAENVPDDETPAEVNGEADGNDDRIHIGERHQRFHVYQVGPRPRMTVAEGPLDIALDDRGWSILDGRHFRLPFSDLEPIEFVPEPLGRDEAPPTIAIGERRYGGYLRLVPRTDLDPDAIDVVNHIALEQYLPGVLARELFNHWRLETHAAQAIAARSFACAEHAYFRQRRHFDMTNTQASQAYIGAVTHRASLDASAMTRGVVLAEDDLIVPGYYSSCCGGVAARAIDAIGPSPINDTPSLHGRSGPCVCDKAPVFEWSNEREVREVARRMVEFGRANRHADLQRLATVTAIEAIAHNEHGRPTLYRVTDSRDLEVEIAAETLRRAVNHSGRGLAAPQRPLRSSNFTVTIKGETIIFEGRGFGHGVGMCQYGAEFLAREGKNHRDILEFFYPGAEIVQAYT